MQMKLDWSHETKLGGLYQGWTGCVWGIEGLDIIERASPGKGLPVFNFRDIWPAPMRWSGFSLNA